MNLSAYAVNIRTMADHTTKNTNAGDLLFLINICSKDYAYYRDPEHQCAERHCEVGHGRCLSLSNGRIYGRLDEISLSRDYRVECSWIMKDSASAPTPRITTIKGIDRTHGRSLMTTKYPATMVVTTNR